MKTTSKYNKSQIMKDAWSNFRVSQYEGVSFSTCLKWAWDFAKAELTQDLSMTVEEIFSELDNNGSLYESILETVVSKSSNYKKDIAEKGLKYGRLSEKQAWAVAYEYKNVA